MEMQQNPDFSRSATILPKYPLPESVHHNQWLTSVKSLVIYVGLGYLLLHRWDLLLLILGVLVLHEAGHFLAMKYYNYTDVSILFLPFVGVLVKGSKAEISQKQSAVILLAGPLPGLILGIILYFIDLNFHGIFIGIIPLQLVAQLLIWANFLNLLPIYPLDGGQLINRVYCEEEGLWSDILFYVSMAVIVAIAISSKFLILLVFPAYFVYRRFKTIGNKRIDHEIEKEGIDINKNYDELSDEDYWKLRNIVVRYSPSLQHLSTDAYQYHAHEQKVAIEIESLLSPRILLLDTSNQLKVILAIVLLLVLWLPWFLGIDFLLLQYLKG